MKKSTGANAEARDVEGEDAEPPQDQEEIEEETLDMDPEAMFSQ